jgi:hypothetical protein
VTQYIRLTKKQNKIYLQGVKDTGATSQKQNKTKTKTKQKKNKNKKKKQKKRKKKKNQPKKAHLKLSARLFVKAEEETFLNWFTQILNLTSRISILAKM